MPCFEDHVPVAWSEICSFTGIMLLTIARLDAFEASMISGVGPPPSRWQLDSPTGGRGLAKSEALALAGNVEEVSNAWKNVKSITDGGKGVDLYDLLSHSVRDTQYSLQHPGVTNTFCSYGCKTSDVSSVLVNHLC